ncbi:MAG: carbamoyltransferase HypF [Chloroflexi bacterium]|nr:carbamoyltransferase HypF [Chloroflexota bacterium]
MMANDTGQAIHITGVVQGVGFRPFVYGLAQRYQLTGWVRNSSAGVDIAVDGSAATLHAFTSDLQTTLPPLARIDTFEIFTRPANGFTCFEIIHSEPIAGAFQPISPDISVCPDCLRELFNPDDGRYHYPFINCTNCGPRFTIIQDIPYDRPQTTMASFPMCPDCQAEYENPLDRRFHAQPAACAVCGPAVWLVNCEQCSVFSDNWEAIRAARRILVEGGILAVKGLGGFHLACDGTNETAVAELRRRKLRVDKPFAMMAADVETAQRYCFVNKAERELLTSRERPIVLLRRRPNCTLSPEVAPRQNHLGIMLPYTPLHYLLLTQSPTSNLQSPALVMTSGNISEEPIAYRNDEALERLSNLADAFLLHNRDIHVRCDDSVMRVISQSPNLPISSYPIRRSRGYAPNPIKLHQSRPSVLATGAELKNVFCLTRDAYAFMSHHIGDLENYETLRSFEEGIDHFERLFRIQPEIIAYDKHPNYLATRYALERAKREGIPAVGVQHHHAHIAACMAEHGLAGERPLIGAALDGTGYGDDGTIWGGEFLVADYGGYSRPYHLQPIPLPGGDTAVRQPWRIALSYLYQAGIGWDEDLPPIRFSVSNIQSSVFSEQLSVVGQQLKSGLNAPLSSGMGRLFDGVAALIGVRQTVNYEAQAAVELEALVDEMETAVYPFTIENGIINPAPIFSQIVTEMRKGVSTAVIAARFHNTVVEMVTAVCRRIRQETSLNEVALSGGVWQNMTLLQRTIPKLQAAGFTVYWHQTVPANDGGLALGQAMIAMTTTDEGRNG